MSDYVIVIKPGAYEGRVTDKWAWEVVVGNPQRPRASYGVADTAKEAFEVALKEFEMWERANAE